MIIPQGSITATSAVAPGLYVVIIPPQIAQLNGVPTNFIGIVGTAAWGPTNVPTVVSGMASYAQQFGPIMPRKFDLGTHVATATLQGAQSFVCVRVTDGTDTAATALVKDTSAATGMTLTGRYTGTLGNTLTYTVANGTKASSFKLTLLMPGLVPEVYDNITGTGLALWTAMTAAVNSGNAVNRGPSQLCTATVGSSTVAPAVATGTFASGTDGTTTITSTVLVGTNSTTRTGMYALTGTPTSIGILSDADDTTQWANQDAFGTQNQIYMMLVNPQGQVGGAGAATAAGNLVTAAIDSYSSKCLMGDWVYFNDTVNQVQRLVSPQGFVAGVLANLSPQNSSLNKKIQGIIGTQSSNANIKYAPADLVTLVNGRIDLVATPSAGGNYYSCQTGQNCSSNSTINGDEYTRLTNYIALTINNGMGPFVGLLQTVDERREAQTTLSSFLSNMWTQNPPMIGDVNNPTQVPFSVIIDKSNNPTSLVTTGVQVGSVQVKYLSVIRKFFINFQGGQTVQIAIQPA